jgi:UDP-N-acetylglucosamine 2-epimerase (non-hydrolysing)
MKTERNKESQFPRIYAVLGTRAQFIKMAPLLKAFKDENIDYKLIYTAQHKETVDEILNVYGLPKPDKTIYHQSEANTKSKFFKWFINILYKAVFESRKILPRKGIVLTHGDTFTAWLAALMGKMSGCKVAHVESGLRSFNIFRPFPEEISRLITFWLSDIYFCPNKWAVNNLRNFKGKKVNLEANTMIDGVKFAANSKGSDFDFQKSKYAVVSIHRYENIFKPIFTDFIIPKLKEISKKCHLVVTLHPTTRERMKDLGIYKEIEEFKSITLHERFNFVDWINVCKKAEFVISDGGSNQEELSYLGIPTILFRSETERTEGLERNVVLSRYDEDIIDKFISNYKDYKKEPLYAEISPSEKIIDYLKNIKV